MNRNCHKHPGATKKFLFSASGNWRRAPNSADDTLKDIELSLQGFDIGQRPSWWIPYADASEAMQTRAKPLSELAGRIDDEEHELLEKTAHKHAATVETLWYLPLTSPTSSEWTAILDKDMAFLDAVEIDAF